MIRDRRGDIGFMEAMVSAMAVCIVLTAFVAFIAVDTVADRDGGPEIDWRVADGVEIVDGSYSGEGVSDDLLAQCEEEGWTGVQLRCWNPAMERSGSTWAFGVPGENTHIERRVMDVQSDDRQLVPTVFEMTVWY